MMTQASPPADPPATMEQDEIALINAAIETGDENYWRSIYHAYFTPLACFIAREFAPVPQDVAEELSYRSLLKLLSVRRRPRFQVKRQLSSWLYKAARTTTLDYFRSGECKVRQETDLVEDPGEFILNLPDDSESDPESHDRTVAGILGRMSDNERLLLSMRANGTPYKTIAEELCIAENAARTGFDRAKKKFARLYKSALI